MSHTFVYWRDLRDDIHTVVASAPTARVHRIEWGKIINGDPVEINPSIGEGFRVMTVEEWSRRWKRNEDFPQCLGCGSDNTREHHFTQTWCRKKKKWQSEILCLDCHRFTWRDYCDPDFKTPEEYEKERWCQATLDTDFHLGRVA